MLDPHDRWIWDFWHVHDGDIHHLFYLQAPRTLGDPELRHRHATIGHATSADLLNWTEHGAVLGPGGVGDVDETATWTGSIVRGHDGRWHMFYTGARFLDPDSHANVEGITVATSDDLFAWAKAPAVRLHADPAWYETLGDSDWPEEAWRDPWVSPADGGGWDMLITARSREGSLLDRGVVGFAHSPDLEKWVVGAPLTSPGRGFAQLEVLQRATVDGRRFVVFSTHERTLTPRRLAAGEGTGIWVAPADDQIDLDAAYMLTGAELYSGRVIDLDGRPVLLGFRSQDGDGAFVGGIGDPIPLELVGDRIAASAQVAS